MAATLFAAMSEERLAIDLLLLAVVEEASVIYCCSRMTLSFQSLSRLIAQLH